MPKIRAFPTQFPPPSDVPLLLLPTPASRAFTPSGSMSEPLSKFIIELLVSSSFSVFDNLILFVET